jgi:hypothetical protein
MSYADTLLSTGERVHRRERQHWLVLLWGARFAIVALLVAVLLLLVRGGLSRDVLDGALGTIVGWIVAGLFIYGLLHFGWMTLRYLNQEYVLTNRRVVQVEGVINKKSMDSSLEKINDAVLSQSLVGRIFGFGDLDVMTASEQAIERFRMIVHPIEFKKAMLDAKHEYEIDMNRVPSMPSPPLRAPVEDGPSAVAPPPTASAPTAPSAPPQTTRSNPDDVTRTLANLADLRDRGAISAEDYESKKADLLGRI